MCVSLYWSDMRLFATRVNLLWTPYRVNWGGQMLFMKLSGVKFLPVSTYNCTYAQTLPTLCFYKSRWADTPPIALTLSSPCVSLKLCQRCAEHFPTVDSNCHSPDFLFWSKDLYWNSSTVSLLFFQLVFTVSPPDEQTQNISEIFVGFLSHNDRVKSHNPNLLKLLKTVTQIALGGDGGLEEVF